MKKWTQGTLFLLLVSSVLVAGCSSRTGQAGGEAPKTEPPAKTEAAKPAPSTGGAKSKLSVYSTVNDPPVQTIYREIGEAFKKKIQT